VGICVGGFLFGYDIGVISGCLIMQPFERVFGGEYDPATMEYTLSSGVSSLITATLSIGTFVGALAQAPVSDYLGRKPSMLVWAFFFTVGAVVQTSAGTFANTSHNLSQIYAGRFFAGLGVGALSGLSPLYLAETAPKAIRGAMVSCYQLLIIFGIFLSYAISYGSDSIKTSSASWRIPVGLQMAWGLLLIVIMIMLPESPRWLLQRNREVEARQVMAGMRGIDLVDDGTGNGLRGDKYMESDLQEMVEGIREEALAFANYNYVSAYALCFSSKNQMWRRTLTGMMLQLLQQLCGQNFYYYYGPTFFKASGSVLNPLLIQLIFGAVSLVCTLPALYSIEKVGRRKSLIIGAFAQATCAFIVAFVGHYGINPAGQAPVNASQKMSANVFIAFAVLHLAFYSALWGPTPWIFCEYL
jgi:SP family sugar:H+ symporter-like MFS transporter